MRRSTWTCFGNSGNSLFTKNHGIGTKLNGD